MTIFKLSSLFFLQLLIVILSIGGVKAGEPRVQTETFELVPNRYASWWRFGDSLEFQALGIPAELASFTGRVFDSENRVVAEVTVSREQLETGPWVWKPEKPGFYEIEFCYKADGSETPIPVRGHYAQKIRKPDQSIEVFEHDKERFQAAVSARTPSPDFKRGQFGFTFADPKFIRLAQLMGFDFAFIQAITWGGTWWDKNSVIEPVKGTYDWSDPDKRINALAKAGFPIAAQFLYIPTWASPHPERDQVRICTREANCYAPVDMKDFDRFVRAAVGRYKDRVSIWEIWNEPSMPDHSVFWYDTPENYAKLLQTGYTAVKETQPEAQVWLAGLGPRAGYYEFYRRILKLGADKWFDILSLHGTWISPEKFRAIESKLDSEHKPAVVSEWHAILHYMGEPGPHPSELELARRMMLDLLYQFKSGIERTVTFVVSNESGYEPETKTFLNKLGVFGQSFGFFRTRPRLEPRFPALVLQNFLALVGNKAVYVSECDLGDGTSGVLLDTAYGRQLVVWLEKDRSLNDLLSLFSGTKIEISDWEGHPVSKDAATTLKAGKFYYVSGLPTSFGKSLAKAEVLVSPRLKKNPGTGNVPAGNVNRGELFPEISEYVSEGIAWNAGNWTYHATGSPGVPARFTAKFAVGVTEKSLDIVVEVTDAVQKSDGPGSELWNGDSIQFAFDCDGSGLEGGNTEFVAALTEQGPEIWKILAAEVGGDLPSKWSSPGSRVANASVRVERNGETVLYKVRLPWSELYPLTYDPEKPLRFSILVNNNDGKGREGYLEWSGGIGGAKDPSAYGALNVLK